MAVTGATPKDRIEAVLAFAFGGLHNAPGKIRHDEFPSPWGNFRASVCTSLDLATFDCNRLTRLVVAAHDQAVRVEIAPDGGPGRVRIVLWTREREGSTGHRHPTIEAVLAAMKDREIWHPEPAEAGS